MNVLTCPVSNEFHYFKCQKRNIFEKMKISFQGKEANFEHSVDSRVNLLNLKTVCLLKNTFKGKFESLARKDVI